MSLMEVVFRHLGQDRNVPFQVIAHETKLGLDEVEHLVMKALSLKLIRGSIDQVKQIVAIEWVQPRLLQKDQLLHLQKELNQWASNLKQLTSFMESQSPELFA